MRHLARDEGLLEGVRFPDLYQRGGGQYPTPHGTNPGFVNGGNARGEGGRVVPGGVTPPKCLSLKTLLNKSRLPDSYQGGNVDLQPPTVQT